MSYRLIVLILVLWMSGGTPTASAQSAPAASPSPIEGLWRASDGSASARIAICQDNQAALCATASGRVVVSNLRQVSAKLWRGSYHDGNDRLPATVELRNRDLAAMTACKWILCQTVTYRRITSEGVGRAKGA